MTAARDPGLAGERGEVVAVAANVLVRLEPRPIAARMSGPTGELPRPSRVAVARGRAGCRSVGRGSARRRAAGRAVRRGVARGLRERSRGPGARRTWLSPGAAGRMRLPSASRGCVAVLGAAAGIRAALQALRDQGNEGRSLFRVRGACGLPRAAHLSEHIGGPAAELCSIPPGNREQSSTVRDRAVRRPRGQRPGAVEAPHTPSPHCPRRAERRASHGRQPARGRRPMPAPAPPAASRRPRARRPP
jgi:hypothetical protein